MRRDRDRKSDGAERHTHGVAPRRQDQSETGGGRYERDEPPVPVRQHVEHHGCREKHRGESACTIPSQRTAESIGCHDERQTQRSSRRTFGKDRWLDPTSEGNEGIEQLYPGALKRVAPVAVRIVVERQVTAERDDTLCGGRRGENVHVARNGTPKLHEE